MQFHNLFSRLKDNIQFTPIKLCIGIVISILFGIVGIWSGASVKAMLVLDMLLIGFSAIRVPIKRRITVELFTGVSFISTAVAILFLTQYVNDAGVLGLGFPNIFRGILLGLVVSLILYAIIGKLRVSLLVSVFALLLLSTANHYVFEFRGSELMPYDLLSVQTAMNVVGQYIFTIPRYVYNAWILAFIYFFALLAISPAKTQTKSFFSRMKAMASVLLLIVIFSIDTANMSAFHFHNGGVWSNGYLLNFTLTLKHSFVTKPNGYDLGELDQLSSQYAHATDDSEKRPNIIVLMNESFSDFCVFDDDFCDKHQILPYYHSLQENAIKGYALSSTRGGKTPNSEFEFLTGNSMAFLPEGSVPYQQFVHNQQYSLVSYLNSLGYYSMATHPFRRSGWNRPTVYTHMGFSDMAFLEDYPEGGLLRDYMSDQAMYEYIIEQYEKRPTQQPLFLFGVTMQNHGGYDYEGFDSTVSLGVSHEETAKAEQYLSLIKHSDAALQYLIEYFDQVKEDVVIVMFGDHLPGLEQDLFETISGKEMASLDDQMDLYKVPFVMWANYDIEEKEIPCTSLNYLSSYLYQAAGLPMPSYNQYLTDVEKEIPAMNAFGFYSIDKECFVSYDEASEAEKKILKTYERVQYNGLFDHARQNNRFFPYYKKEE